MVMDVTNRKFHYADHIVLRLDIHATLNTIKHSRISLDLCGSPKII